MLVSVIKPAAALYAKPDGKTELETELLFGETFQIEKEQDGWLFGTSQIDGYQGYVESCHTAPSSFGATHIISAGRSCLYQSASAKATPTCPLPMAAQVRVEEKASEGFVKTAFGFIPERHLTPLDSLNNNFDFVERALALQGTPYLWGGRSSCVGLDCSALIQLALSLAGVAAPRNSSEQEASLGETLDAAQPLQRGDLVFWRAHTGIMIDENRILHANAFHMAVAHEPLAQATKRIQKVVGDIRAIKRVLPL